MSIVTCPHCCEEVEFENNPKIGDFILCNECGTNLEVVWLYPIDLDYADEINLSGRGINNKDSCSVDTNHV